MKAGNQGSVLSGQTPKRGRGQLWIGSLPSVSPKKTAEEFFSKLRKAEVRCLLDIRLNNSSQLAGFTKKPDLEYFLMGNRGDPLPPSAPVLPDE